MDLTSAVTRSGSAQRSHRRLFSSTSDSFPDLDDVEAHDSGHVLSYSERRRLRELKVRRATTPTLHSPITTTRTESASSLRADAMSSLDDSLLISAVTEDMAISTASKLNSQKKQLENIDRTLHETEAALGRSQYLLRGIRSWTGQIANWFTSPSHPGEYKSPAVESSSHSTSDKKKSDPACSSSSSSLRGMSGDTDTMISGITAEKSDMSDDSTTKMENEMGDKLDELLAGVTRLKMIATDINGELTEQDKIIHSISERMDRVESKVDDQNDSMNRLLKK